MMSKNQIKIFFGLLFLAITSSLVLPGLIHSSAKEDKSKMKTNKLTDQEKHVILNKGTERPFTGKYYNFFQKGYYVCKQCDKALYRSDDKFHSNCGWPSFDDEIEGAVKRKPDPDGRRTEILCAQCGGHLGHVFFGEKFTSKDTRHCVNSISLKFIPDKKVERAIFASGCFWGTQYHFQKKKGVLETIAGYTGGNKANPTYEEVCSGSTGHAESVLVAFNTEEVTYEDLAKLYFETHDPTQLNRQGPDIGEQYRSEIFYYSPQQKATADKLIKILASYGLKVVTRVTPAGTFYPAESYHQGYYLKNGGIPYCHIYTKRF